MKGEIHKRQEIAGSSEEYWTGRHRLLNKIIAHAGVGIVLEPSGHVMDLMQL